MTRAPAPATPRGIRPGLMVALGYVSMAGSLSTDLYLPSFPSIADDLGAGASTVQFTLTAFLIGSAFGQLLLGAISDALGRRRTLIVALSAFAACGFLASLSPSIGVLVAVRAVQGFAGASGAVLARAIVADLTDHAHAVRAFSTLFVFIALGPAVASPLGGLLTQVGGWRAAMLGLAVIATGMVFAAAALIPESLPAARRHPFTPSALLRNLGGLVRRFGFVGYALAYGAGYAALMVYISSSSFIVQDVFGYPPLAYGLTFSLSSVAVMLGAWLNGRIAHRLGATRTLRIAQALVLVAAVAGTAATLSGALSFALYLGLVFLFAAGCGSVMSSASALAVGQARSTPGAGSALVGFTQFGFGALASPLGGLWGTGTALPAMTFMAVFAVIGLVSAGLAARRAVEVR